MVTMLAEQMRIRKGQMQEHPHWIKREAIRLSFLAQSAACLGAAVVLCHTVYRANGSVKKKVLPVPNSLLSHIRPPCCSTRCFVIASPNPVPSRAPSFFKPNSAATAIPLGTVAGREVRLWTVSLYGSHKTS